MATSCSNPTATLFHLQGALTTSICDSLADSFTSYLSFSLMGYALLSGFPAVGILSFFYILVFGVGDQFFFPFFSVFRAE